MAELRSDNYFSIVPEWVTEAESISDQAYRVYALMQRYANSETGEVFPAVGTLASRLHRSDRSIQRALRELEEVGAIYRIEPENERVTYTYLLRTQPLTNLTGEGDKNDGEGGDNSDTLSREPLSKEGTSPPANADGDKPRTVLQHMFEEMVFAWFQRPFEEMEPVLTKTHRQRINAAIKELHAIGVGKGQITFAAREYRAKWQNMELTPQALVKHWHSFNEDAVGEAAKRDHKHDFELTETDTGYRYCCTTCGEVGPALGVVNGGG